LDEHQVKKVRDLLQKKNQLVETLFSYAKQQSELLFSDNSIQYSNIIEARSHIIEDLKKIDIALQHHLATIQPVDGKLNQQINEAGERIVVLIKQIATLDEKSKVMLTNEMDAVKHKLQALQKGKKGLLGYNNNESKLNLAGAYTDSKR
jgi:hypothetical protein